MQTFTKAERLCSKVIMDKVFETGKVIVVPSFKLIWLKADKKEEQPVQIVITVPKRNFKRAVDRNKLKRRIREVYRKNKGVLYSSISSESYYMMLIYTGRNIIEYKEIEEKILKLLQRLLPEIDPTCNTLKQ
jgi:ribonuclease P protein component